MSKPIVLKVLTAGEGGVGKTTLLHRYVEGKFSSETKMTIGVEFFLKELNIDGQKVLLQLWDFGGQERFRFLLESYVIGARGALLMFDLTRTITLENIDQWVNICRKENPDLPILFLGSKSDLIDDVAVDQDYIEEFLERYNLFDYLKVSSKTGENVELSFESLTREVIDKIF
jgi:small GTP-binding protein